MSCSTSNMQIIRRDDVDFELTFTDADGDIIDITGATVFFTVKRKITDPDVDAVIEKEITLFDFPTEGKATLTLSTTDTNIAAGLYYFDIQLKTLGGRIASSRYGKFIVDQDITVRTT